MDKSKVKNNVVKLTVIRDSSYDRYMRKLQPRATCQCRTVYVRSIKPARSDFKYSKLSEYAGISGLVQGIILMLGAMSFPKLLVRK